MAVRRKKTCRVSFVFHGEEGEEGDLENGGKGKNTPLNKETGL